ncbi:MAG: hypothetical protein QM730_03355 [Anaerolineales bacterium]
MVANGVDSSGAGEDVGIIAVGKVENKGVGVNVKVTCGVCVPTLKGVIVGGGGGIVGVSPRVQPTKLTSKTKIINSFLITNISFFSPSSHLLV